MIVLIRHGEAEHNVENIFDSNINSRVHLTNEGIKQIENVSIKIRDYFNENLLKVSRIFCSPLLRTVESARIFKEIMKDNNLYKDERFCIDYRIREIEMGKFDGKLISSYPDGDHNFHVNDKYGGENTSLLQKRCNSFIDNLNPYNVNVVITHGEPFRRMIYYLLNKNFHAKQGHCLIIDQIGNDIIYDSES
jgi:broad specificity phosphatase PhoE